MKQIILGTVQFGLLYGINNRSGKPATTSVFDMLKAARNAGILTLDTADGYGDAADLIGDFHRNTGECFGINTKFTIQNKMAASDLLKESIEKLSVKKINVYFYHSFKEYQACPQFIHELETLKAGGEIQKIGLSVYTNAELATALNDRHIDVIQLPFNLLDNYSQRGALLQKARENGKQIQVRSVFLQGLFFKDANTLPVKLLPLQPYLEKINQLAAENNCSVEQLCLQYVNAQTCIDEVIIGIDNKEQMIRNVEFMHGVLPPEICAQIDAIQVKDTELLYPYNWN